MSDPKIYALNAMASGLDALNLLVGKIPLAGVIGLDTENTSKISNYRETRTWAGENNIPYISVDDYSFKNVEDINRLQYLEIDILIVTGWQRLIPKWLIEQCKIGVIGAHGSPWGITKGRGRSPQNWTILIGEKIFSLSAFLIQPGADDGPVLATRQYQLLDTDDIVSSYVKSIWLYSQMIVEVIPKLLSGWRGNKQTGEPEYLPQRILEDGKIDWNWNSLDIDRQIRALTRPYPGAWTMINEKTIYIWKAQPIEFLPGFDAETGEIIAVYPEIPSFLVKTGDGALLVREWEIVDVDTMEFHKDFLNEIKVKEKFNNDFSGYEQLKKIFERHVQKYPDNKLAEQLICWSEKYADRVNK